MFGELDRYSDEAYRNEYPVIKYLTEACIEVYEVTAACSLDVSQPGILEGLPLCEKSQVEALVQTISAAGGNIYGEFCEDTDYLSLVTCEDTGKHGRYFVIAKKIGEIWR